MNKRTKIAILLLIITAAAHVYGNQPKFPDRLVFSTSPVDETVDEMENEMGNGLANEIENDSPVIAPESPVATTVPAAMSEGMDGEVPTMRRSPIFERVRTGDLPNENEGRRVFPQNQNRTIDGLPQFYDTAVVMQNIQRNQQAVLQNSPASVASVASPDSMVSDDSALRSIDMDQCNLDDFNLDD